MESQLFAAIGICFLQLFFIWIIISERKKVEKIAGSLSFTIKVDETKLDEHLNLLFSQLRRDMDDAQSQDIIFNQTTAEVIKQITDALEAISLDKSKDVKIIVSNDKLNQERFTIKLSFRPA